MTDNGGPEVGVQDGDVVATVTLPGIDAAGALERWTDPAALRAWWGGELTADLRPGGAYVVEFPQLGQTMRGAVRQFRPGEVLEFSWGWDHEPARAGRTVRVFVEERDEGVRVTIRHGPHGGGPGEERAMAEHVEGWRYFLARLAASTR